jgi:glycosyltransferase involved in cell wall biosynthesis
MKNSIRFSLIIATLGRKDTVARVLQSLVVQSYAMSTVEVIIVDQNRSALLDEVVEKFRDQLNLIHIRSPILGLSLNRNLGLEKASGEVVGFPDDDCEYPSDFLSKIDAVFLRDNVNLVLGSVWDPRLAKQAIRKWPAQKLNLNRFNFYRLTSSIALFTTLRAHRFDERFGLGAQYGSNEDVIFVYSLLNQGANGVYYPDLRVFHDDQPMSSLDVKKVSEYAKGFGKFARLYASPYVLIIFGMSIAFQLIGCAVALMRFDNRLLGLRYTSLKCRLGGFFF